MGNQVKSNGRGEEIRGSTKLSQSEWGLEATVSLQRTALPGNPVNQPKAVAEWRILLSLIVVSVSSWRLLATLSVSLATVGKP